MIKLVSIELTNKCSKGCSFCYNRANPDGATVWAPMKLAAFITDLAANGVEAISFGGGEPLEYPLLWDMLERIRPVPVFKSMTTNGLCLTEESVVKLSQHLNKVHISLHYPEDEKEVARVIQQVLTLARTGLRSGINFLIKGDNLEADKAAVQKIREAGIETERVTFLPLKMQGKVDLAKFGEVTKVLATGAESAKIASMSCLMKCGKSERFCSVNWEGKAAWCSYTKAKTPIQTFTYAGLMEALVQKEVVFCG